MFEPVETLQIDADNRVVVTQDPDAESPIGWGWIGIVQVRGGRFSGDLSEDMGSPELQAVADRIKRAREECEYFMPNATDADVDRAGMRAARRAGYDAVQVMLGSVYCSEYVVFVESPGYGSASGAVDEIQQWLDGDVYTLTHERRHVWRDDNGDELHTWDHVESIGGFYGLETYDGDAVAAEALCHFDLAAGAS